MGLFNFGKKKEQLLQWQKLVVADSPDKLIMNERQLKSITAQQASDDLRIIQDCNRIVSETTKPDTFFTRLDLLKSKSYHLTLLEPYITFTGASPTDAYQEVLEKEQDAIYEFIVRYFGVVWDKAESLKTEKGKKNQYQKFYDSLEPYFDVMNDHNIKYIKYKVRDRLD